jgi:hypothetical protein
MSNPAIAPLHALQDALLALEHKQLGLDDFWWRLVSMRHHHELHDHDCDSERNFLTRLHSINSPLEKQRESTRRAVLHWFLRGEGCYTAGFDAGDRVHCSDRAIELLNRAGTRFVMDELERRWDEPVSQISYSDDGTGFWTESVLEAFEGGNTSGRHKALEDTAKKGH